MHLYDTEGHVTYALRNADIKKWPFPHFFATHVFPWDFYGTLVKLILDRKHYKGSTDRLYGRAFSDPSDIPALAFMNSETFMATVANIFLPQLRHHFSASKVSLFSDLRLVRDGRGYQIGPHTDAPWKLVSLLFYLPPDGEHEEHGTSMYIPKNPNFRCPGGPHHHFDDFKIIGTAPFVPNACFGFFKTDNSFHGVEPINIDIQRDVLLYNLYDRNIYLQYHQSPVEDAK